MKRLRRIFFGVVLVIGMVAAGSVILHYQLRAAAERSEAGLKQAGLVVDLGEALPPVPASTNEGTIVYLRAMDLMGKNSTNFDATHGFFPTCEMVAPGKALITFYNRMSAASPGPTPGRKS